MPVVYDGMNTGHGSLFKGIKLWISHRVPQRSRYVDLVKENGGKVVLEEKNADMLIADNVRRAGLSPPDGSYCWKWIDTSVKNGFLEEKSDYLIRTEVRSGTSQPAKSYRNAFSPTEDLILLKWVTANKNNGAKMTNRELFDELARKYPQHTSQSWQSRWVKNVKDKPRPSEKEELELAHEAMAQTRPSTGQASAADIPSRTTETARQAQQNGEARLAHAPPSPQHRAPGISTPASLSQPAPRGRNPFTDEEDRLLLAYVQEMRRLGRPLRGNIIYQEFADAHPTHTMQSWRDRWVKTLYLRECVDDDEPDEHSNAAQDKSGGHGAPETSLRSNIHDSNSANSLASDPIPSNGETEASGTVQAPSPGTRPATSRQPNPKSDEQRLKKREQEKTETRAAKLVQRTWRGHIVRRDQAQLEAAVVPLQAMMRGYLLRLREAERLAKAMEATNEADRISNAKYHDHTEEGPQGTGTGLGGIQQYRSDARNDFYDDLEMYIRATGAEIIGRPSIHGRPIDLWDFFSLATLWQPEDRDWEQIASQLGFDIAIFPGLVQEVRECYLQNLAVFEETIRACDNNDGSEEDVDEEPEELACDETAQDLVPTSDAVMADQQPLADPSSPAYQSSPPFAASRQSRPQPELLTSDPSYPTIGSRKRRRLSKDVEIPSTPEEKLELARNQLRRGAAYNESSPLKSRGTAKRKVVEMNLGEESDDAFDADMEDVGGVEWADELPNRVEPQKRKYIEPETQDWRFGMDNEQDFRRSIEEDDFSPSQQLQTESNAYHSPQRFVAQGHVTLRQTATRPRVAGETGTRVYGAPLRGVTKRALPPQYQRKPDLAAPMLAPASNPPQNATAQPRPQPRLSNSVRRKGTSPVQPTHSSTPRAQISPYTPKPGAMHSKRAPTSPPSSVPKPSNGNRATPTRVSEMIHGKLYIDAQIEHFQGLGYKEKHILRALEAANWQRGPMTVAVQSFAQGRGIPPNEAGIWTTDDDDDLRMTMEYDRRREKGKYVANAAVEKRMEIKVFAAQSRLGMKHGELGVKQRVEFMKLMEPGENEQQT